MHNLSRFSQVLRFGEYYHGWCSYARPFWLDGYKFSRDIPRSIADIRIHYPSARGWGIRCHWVLIKWYELAIAFLLAGHHSSQCAGVTPWYKRSDNAQSHVYKENVGCQ